MGTLRTALVIVGRRMTANVRIVLALLLGVVVAASLLASAPIYARAMADLGLVFSVQSRFPVPPTTRVLTLEEGLPLKSPEAQPLTDAIPRRMRERLGWFSSGYSRFIRMPALAAGKPGEPIPTNTGRPVALVQSMDGYESHVRVTAGALPHASDAASDPAEFQVAVPASAGASSGLAVGDRVLLGDVFDDCERHIIGPDQPPDPPCTPHTTVSRSVTAVVSGLVEPLRQDDPFWADGIAAYFAPTAATTTNGAGVPVFMPAATLTGSFADRFPTSWPRQYWYAYADPGRLTRDNYQRASNDLEAFRKEMEDAGVLSFSTLPNALADFGRQLSYDQAPLVILLLQITGIALFYVAIVAAMAVERQQPEIALLRSRGASSWQILTVYLIEGLVVALPAAVIAPFLGLAFTRMLGLTPAFHAVTNGHLIPATVELSAFALGALGAILSVVAILVPAFFATHFSGITLRRQLGRPQSSIVQRYYLDLGLLGVCGVLLWETSSRGSVFKPGTTGGLSTDPLLLLAPALTTLALAVLVLRVYPLLLRAAGRLFAAGAGVTVVLGLWQMTRNPAQYTRLGLLLMMGIAVGGFSASYSDTTNRSYRERALYAAAVDLRGAAQSGNNFTGPKQADEAFRQINGVQNASGALRMDVDIGSAGTTRDKVQLLALDPAAGRSMLWYRPGLSHDSLDSLMNDLGVATDQIGKPVPGEPVTFSLWANPTLVREQTTAWARFRDVNGHYDMYELGKLDFTGWRQITAQLNSVGNRPKFPISLVAIVLTQPASGFATKQDPAYFDDFSVAQANGTEDTIETFENSFGWTAAPSIAAEQDGVAASSEAHHSGTRSLKFTFRTGSSAELRAAYVVDANAPLPAVVSRDFVRHSGLAVGSITNLLVGGQVVPIKIAGVADLFPSLDPGRGPYVLLNRTDLLEWLPRFTPSPIDGANEFWLQLDPAADRQAIIRTLSGSPYKLTNITDLATELKLNGADPLIASGGSGILLISFIAALVLAAGAFLISLYTSLRRRRIEFAVMGALGLGRSRVFAMLAFEYAVIAAIGAGAGLWLGLGISRLMLSFLDVTPSGDKVVPPYVLVTNWTMIGAALGCLGLIVLGSIAFAAHSYTSASESAVLRNTE